MHTAPRIHYMDNLRALAMLAGVVFHAALAYSPLLHPYWPMADADSSAIVDVVAWFLHLFRIPLFFVVAGFFAALLVERRGMAALFRNRCARVLLPLLLFLLPVLLSLHWLTMQAAATIRNPSPVLVMVRAYIAEHGALPLMPSLAHLWFLFYLLLFTLLVWVVTTLELKRFGAWLAKLRPVTLLVLTPLLLTPWLASVTVPWPAPESFVPSLWALAYFGLHFALGYQLFNRPALLDGLRRFAPLLLLGALAMYAALPWVLGEVDSAALVQAAPMKPALIRHVMYAVLEAYAGFWMTLWCLVAGKAWLDHQSRSMRWFADASYWVYLVHLPVLFAIQYLLLDVQAHWAVEFTASTLLTFAISLASYQWLVRHTLVGRLLNGKLRKPVTPPAPAPATD